MMIFPRSDEPDEPDERDEPDAIADTHEGGLVTNARWWLIPIVLAAMAPPAFAQPASVQAQSLFDEGRRLRQAGKIAEACAAFDASQKLDPVVTTLLNLAECREQNHQLATAWGAFVDANRMARASNNDKLGRVASSHAHKLEPRLSRLTISVPADRQVAGLQILRGNDLVDAAGWNHALPIDGGSYTITARAPGRTPWSVARTIKVEGDTVTVEIPKLTDATSSPVARAGGTAGPSAEPRTGHATGAAPAPPPVVATRTGGGGGAEAPAASPAPAPDRSDAGAPDRPEPARSYLLPIGFGAGALALGGAALGFDLWGDRTYNRAKTARETGASQSTVSSLVSSANTRRYLAEGFGVAALGCAGAAVYFYVTGRGEVQREATAVIPVASPQLTGLAITGAW